MKISVLCPTRKRPQNMERLVKSIYKTSRDPDLIEVIFYIDHDDSDSSLKAEELKCEYNVHYIVGERIVLSQMWNECHQIASGEIFFHCGDDIIIRTDDWDKTVRDTFEIYHDKIVFVYGDDMNPGIPEDFGTHGFIHKNWTDTVGYFVPPYFSSDWNDTWLNDVAKALGRHHRIAIQTEHMHPGPGKATYDITHQERLARGSRDNVEYLYRSTIDQRQEDVYKLRDFIEGYDED